MEKSLGGFELSHLVEDGPGQFNHCWVCRPNSPNLTQGKFCCIHSSLGNAEVRNMGPCGGVILVKSHHRLEGFVRNTTLLSL